MTSAKKVWPSRRRRRHSTGAQEPGRAAVSLTSATTRGRVVRMDELHEPLCRRAPRAGSPGRARPTGSGSGSSCRGPRPRSGPRSSGRACGSAPRSAARRRSAERRTFSRDGQGLPGQHRRRQRDGADHDAAESRRAAIERREEERAVSDDDRHVRHEAHRARARRRRRVVGRSRSATTVHCATALAPKRSHAIMRDQVHGRRRSGRARRDAARTLKIESFRSVAMSRWSAGAGRTGRLRAGGAPR